MFFEDGIDFMSMNFLDKNKTEENKLVSEEVGFLRGNMFEDEYVPYKNYTYSKIVPRTEREALLLEIMELCFAITDLNIYLDLHPNDESLLRKFRNLVENSCAKEMEFVKKYGPIEVIDSDNKENFSWIKDPWPWQNERGAKYI